MSTRLTLAQEREMLDEVCGWTLVPMEEYERLLEHQARKLWRGWAEFRGFGCCDGCGELHYCGRARRCGRRLCADCWEHVPEGRRQMKRLRP
jgi:hypothetical protein